MSRDISSFLIQEVIMKFIFVFLMMAFTCSAFAIDQQALSKFISSNYQEMIDEQASGNYNSTVSVTYIVQIATGSETLPVLFLPQIQIEVPFKMQDCSESSEGLTCNLAAQIIRWYEIYSPVYGQFQINLELGTSEKTIFFSF